MADDEALARWLEQVTGYPVDEKSVALAGTLRLLFQRSEWWRTLDAPGGPR